MADAYQQIAQDASHAAEIQLRLTDPSLSTPILAEVTANEGMASEQLKERVLAGREKQFELTSQLREVRERGDAKEIADVMEQRRVYHIATILARAEVLTRDDQTSLSQYSGDEGQFDDTTILERAAGFLRVEADQSINAEERARLLKKISVFKAAEERVRQTDY